LGVGVRLRDLPKDVLRERIRRSSSAAEALVMSSESTVARWIDGVRQGDPAAAEDLWNACFPELVRFAHEGLLRAPRRAADEEDIALSALGSFYHAVQQGRFAELADRNELLRLLLRMTSRKVVDLIRRETSLRRGRGRIRGDSALEGGVANPTYDSPTGPCCTPELAAMMADEMRRLLQLLPDEALRRLALAKMEGFTNGELAQRLGCSRRTVERRLHLIREIWQHERPP
jgi:DNA-directed RNA polymerase specialized sigma24 family protein